MRSFMILKNLLFLFLSTVLGVSACSYPKPVYETPEGYDLNAPHKFFLSENLLEISGLDFHRNNDSIWGVADEFGRIYGFRLGKKKTHHVKFGPQGDYEDMEIHQDKVFVLRSDGELSVFALPHKKKQAKEVDTYDVLPKGEYEGLHINEKNQLYVLCKNCGKEDRHSIKGHVFQIKQDELVYKEPFTIDLSEFYARVDHKKRFRPSGIAQHRHTKEWYIISAVNKTLIITDSLWNINNVYPLNPSLFRQPEGITFDEENNLYISNEGDDVVNATILKFSFNQPLEVRSF